jgi:hypothetical protein
VTLSGSTAETFTIKVANCIPNAQCAEKRTVNVPFEMKDASALAVTTFEPVNTYTDGGTYLTAQLRRLPTGLTADDVVVEFHDVATITSLSYIGPVSSGTSAAAVTVRVPQANTPGTLTPTVRLASGGTTASFPASFQYRQPPTPEISRVNPKFASNARSERVLLSVSNFPWITALSDIQVMFRWPSDGHEIYAQVLALYTSMQTARLSCQLLPNNRSALSGS